MRQIDLYLAWKLEPDFFRVTNFIPEDGWFGILSVWFLDFDGCFFMIKKDFPNEKGLVIFQGLIFVQHSDYSPEELPTYFVLFTSFLLLQSENVYDMPPWTKPHYPILPFILLYPDCLHSCSASVGLQLLALVLFFLQAYLPISFSSQVLVKEAILLVCCLW